MVKDKLKIGLFSGSFNPIHKGHTGLATYILQQTCLDKIWFVVSPCNPLKTNSTLLNEQLRLHMVQLALAEHANMQACDIEFNLPRPSYTISTLEKLSATYPNIEFSLIIGWDNWELFDKWKDYKRILEGYQVLVYPRNFVQNNDLHLPHWTKGIDITHVQLIKAPLLPISSTEIRAMQAQKKDTSMWLHANVSLFIAEKQLYTE